jgi:hypothetical protein
MRNFLIFLNCASRYESSFDKKKNTRISPRPIVAQDTIHSLLSLQEKCSYSFSTKFWWHLYCIVLALCACIYISDICTRRITSRYSKCRSIFENQISDVTFLKKSASLSFSCSYSFYLFSIQIRQRRISHVGHYMPFIQENQYSVFCIPFSDHYHET